MFDTKEKKKLAQNVSTRHAAYSIFSCLTACSSKNNSVGENDKGICDNISSSARSFFPQFSKNYFHIVQLLLLPVVVVSSWDTAAALERRKQHAQHWAKNKEEDLLEIKYQTDSSVE